MNMNSSQKIAALAVLCVMQLGAATWSIVRHESILRSGVPYRIRAAPIDPADAFRGRYVAVSPSIVLAQPLAPETERLVQLIQGGETGYAVLANDDEGFARAAQILPAPPAQGDYLEIKNIWPQWARDSPPGQAPAIVGYNVLFGFDRYYMNETAAPAAEQRYFEAARRNAASRAWLTVRVKNGAGVVEGLFIDGVPIETVVASPPR